jgi:hypothetical protein
MGLTNGLDVLAYSTHIGTLQLDRTLMFIQPSLIDLVAGRNMVTEVAVKSIAH